MIGDERDGRWMGLVVGDDVQSIMDLRCSNISSDSRDGEVFVDIVDGEECG
jgi:hypothetical protein